jgi:pilus assembly protein CpaC
VKAFLSLAAVVSLAGIVPAQAGVQRQDAANDLSIVVGRAVLLDTAQRVERVALGLGGFAEATAISPTEIMISGKAPGETSLILWEADGNREFFNVTVRASAAGDTDKLESVRRELRNELPGQNFQVSTDNGAVFLRGTVKDLTSSARAVQIASASGKVVNLLNVEVPTAAPQILLKVVFASVDRTRSKELGINIFSNGFGNVISGVTTGQFSPPAITPQSGAPPSLSNELNLFAFLPGLNLGATLQALETKGLVQVLAEPNVLTENGKLGTFLAGGEYPYPVVQGSSGTTGPSISIMFKEYGVRLNFIPTITPRGTIHLQVAPEVSSLDFTNAIELSGFEVPAIDIRRVRTEVELAEGQSFAIGGLLDNRVTETFQKIPFIGSIPILGKFFQSIDRTKTNTELIVIVTPEIVQPIPKGTGPPRLTYPQPFLPRNSYTELHTPEKPPGTVTPPAPTSIPVETLLDSMRPETPLPSETYSAQGTSGSQGNSTTNSNAPSAPQQ